MEPGTHQRLQPTQGDSISTRTREEGSAAAFKEDLDRLVLQKATQLNHTAANLFADPQPPGSPLVLPAPRILPAVVPAGQFPSSPITTQYLREETASRGLLVDPRIEPLMVLDLRDLEHAQSVRERDGASLPELLAEWRDSTYWAFSLSDYLYWRDHERGLSLDRPGSLQRAMDAGFDLILSRLREES